MPSKKKTSKKKAAPRKRSSMYASNEQPKGCLRCGCSERTVTHTYYGPASVRRRRCKCKGCGQCYVTKEPVDV